MNFSNEEITHWFNVYILGVSRLSGVDSHSLFKDLMGYESRNFAKQKAYEIAYTVNKSTIIKNLTEEDDVFSCW